MKSVGMLTQCNGRGAIWWRALASTWIAFARGRATQNPQTRDSVEELWDRAPHPVGRESDHSTPYSTFAISGRDGRSTEGAVSASRLRRGDDA